ncbi:hypothetical protein [Marinomonas profundimaris]|uniref:Uncharacterized protein n=1 Tax=Marinomonas profundimaris TaxID=1208321 RepID=W1RX01_9GAMM|nr:hypothetical protein [Marinomonas profundimaris]ETI59368.1 hypothetical protein D104_13130 [Marinomonas profundimaris]
MLILIVSFDPSFIRFNIISLNKTFSKPLSRRKDRELFPLLLKNGLIEDGANTYEHLLATDWPTRERYIEASTKFLEYITPKLLQADLADFLASKKIELDIKVSVVERAEKFTVDCGKNDLIELARFSIEQGQALPTDVIEKMANHGIENQSIIFLLAPHLAPEMNIEQLFRILELLKGDYPQLVSTSIKRKRSA